MSKVGTPKGTRDFSPAEMVKRNYIFSTIRASFEKFGFMPLETPAMENLSVLTGKYGEEGDRLLFKILNSGDYLDKTPENLLNEKNSRALTKHISEKGLKYDLTVPFARFVATNHGTLSFPFKRYQIQPVWRADRPQKGRYREFFQCDADIVGKESLLCEVDLIQLYDDVFKNLKLDGISIVINNRKILTGIAETLGAKDKMVDMTMAIDKLDKIGKDKVLDELRNKSFTEDQLSKLSFIFTLSGSNVEKLNAMKEYLKDSETGLFGITELETIFKHTDKLGVEVLDFDVTLARGLDYYTGAIFEIKVLDGSMGSLGGGGRYDNLTEIFGVKNLSGVGISFGADRIYDVMTDRNLFPDNLQKFLDVLFINFDDDCASEALSHIKNLRHADIKAELFPESDKMKKQMKYANDKGARFVAMLGEDERQKGLITVKNMQTGEQKSVSPSELIAIVKA
ncbi:histidine--tRNA ligase [Bacteriovorax sp. BSW11_IV]|uniref:histidine--tRNA ligase n=1 Tax=Bacteriovorax sp. BSW11_IV TaxID=1353529 RepID=UPI00038A446E|nr:histidine--tRNA ligase [Bacteriovorax sp. BSW11_IV]EQC48876.1 histidine--tRNA ligase [Bacteriovorax sp. BSW11_IV]